MRIDELVGESNLYHFTRRLPEILKNDRLGRADHRNGEISVTRSPYHFFSMRPGLLVLDGRKIYSKYSKQLFRGNWKWDDEKEAEEIIGGPISPLHLFLKTICVDPDLERQDSWYFEGSDLDFIIEYCQKYNIELVQMDPRLFLKRMIKNRLSQKVAL